MNVVIGAVLKAGNRASEGPGGPTSRKVIPGSTVGTVVAIVTTRPQPLIDSVPKPPRWLVEPTPRRLLDSVSSPVRPNLVPPPSTDPESPIL